MALRIKAFVAVVISFAAGMVVWASVYTALYHVYPVGLGAVAFEILIFALAGFTAVLTLHFQVRSEVGR